MPTAAFATVVMGITEPFLSGIDAQKVEYSENEDVCFTPNNDSLELNAAVTVVGWR